MEINEVKDLVNQCSDIDLRHTHSNLAWGVVGRGDSKDWVYAMTFDSAMTVGCMSKLASTVKDSCGNLDDYGSRAPICVLYTSSDMSKGFCVVMPLRAYKTVAMPALLGDLDMDNVIPIFIGDTLNLFADYFVPMAKVGSSYTPITWLSPNVHTTNGDVECECNETQVIDVDWFTACYTKMKNHYPSVDLEIAEDSRFADVNFAGISVIYNRNHVGHQGNTSVAKAMLPFGIIRARLTGREMWCNIANVYRCGSDADAWRTAQILKYDGIVGEVKEEDMPAVEKFINAGIERPDNPGETPLSKALFGATGSYKN